VISNQQNIIVIGVEQPATESTSFDSLKDQARWLWRAYRDLL